MTAPNFHHFLLTRFSYRPPIPDARDLSKYGADWFLRHDPLNPEILEYRFALFELVCLPNVLAQSVQDFDWILIIDPDLPADYRQRLEKLISGRARTYLHEICASDHLDRLEWLEDYTPADTRYVLTTLLDDDDILPAPYIENLQAHINGLGPAVPAFMTVGVKKSYQWDIYASRKNPFGTLAPWHRPRWFRSAGFSILCETSKYPLTCLAMSHMVGDIWFETGSLEEFSRVMQERWGVIHHPQVYHAMIRGFRKGLTKHAGHDWQAPPNTALCFDLSNDGAFVVQTNHFLNDQGDRLLESKPNTTRVVDTELSSGVVRIDWSVFHRHRGMFKLSLKQCIKYMRESISTSKQLKLNFWKKFLHNTKECYRLVSWFLSH